MAAPWIGEGRSALGLCVCVCAGEKSWMSVVEGQPGLQRGGSPWQGAKENF